MAIESSISTAQLTDTVLMISPDCFGFNTQTAPSNSFQNSPSLKILEGDIKNSAMQEFKKAVIKLQQNGITVITCPSKNGVVTPDAVFPNNWISFHRELGNTRVVLYPMLAPNRRAERQFEKVTEVTGISIEPAEILDLTGYEASGHFLEGTGSLIFDRKRKIVFAHESPRTSYIVLKDFCKKTGYEPIKFHAYDKQGKPIYHTNIVMTIGEGFSVICLESIAEKSERNMVTNELDKLQLQRIDITLTQMHSFCGNILELQSGLGRNRIVMSQTAYDAFTQDQREQLLRFGDITPIRINTIETVGGGSARCALAEVF